MAKKPKSEWQIAVRGKLDALGIGYRELAEMVGSTEDSVRQAMCRDNMPGIKKKIMERLGVE